MSGVEWGAPIEVAGKRPDWLRDDDKVLIGWGRPVCSWSQPGAWTPAQVSDELLGSENLRWWNVGAIKLIAIHAAYTVQRYNAKHGTNFTYWPGGDCAPGDWDGGEILFIDGKEGDKRSYNSLRWTHNQTVPHFQYRDIIGYTRRPVVNDDTVTIKRMKLSEWVILTRESPLSWARAAGLICEPTQAERISAKVGLTVAQVEAVLREVK